jgi:hypothetical protein
MYLFLNSKPDGEDISYSISFIFKMFINLIAIIFASELALAYFEPFDLLICLSASLLLRGLKERQKF